jgi:cobalt/nickel transport system permease protein
MLGMLFVRSFDRSGGIYEAMLLRGFSGRFHSLAVFRVAVPDAVFAATLSACMAGILAYDRYGTILRG